MIGVYLICFVIFPVSILMQTRKIEGRNVLLEKEDVDVIKGMAACLVILAHLIMNLKEERAVGAFLNIFQVAGVIGVFLFFFVSGYGMYKGYGEKEPSFSFWYNRFFNMYFPCILIQFFFCLIKMYQQKNFSFYKVLVESLFYGWFIDVILIQYLVFFMAWIISKGKKFLLIFLTFLFSSISCMIFYYKGFDARWYNNLWLFPVGIAIGWKEQKLIIFMKHNWLKFAFFSFLFFVILGGFRTYAYWGGSPVSTNLLKVISGICLSLFVCAIFSRIQLCSYVMKYIGKRSLFFYIVHVELLEILDKVKSIKNIHIFYLVPILTFVIVELLYRIYIKCIKKG